MQPCPHCPRHKPPVPPSGSPRRCRYLLIGEAPARNEDRYGRVFTGASGKELDFLYLPLAGLTRQEVAVCNAHACSLRAYRSPKPHQARACADYHLPSLLALYDPEMIILCGSVACSLVHHPKEKVNLTVDHGIPFIGRLYEWVGPMVPMFHPAAGMRDTEIMSQLLEDFERLRPMVRDGEFAYGVTDEFEGKPLDYGVCRSFEDVEGYVRQGDPWKWGLDTETVSQGPEPQGRTDEIFCLSMSNRPGTGRVILAEDLPLIKRLFTLWLESSPVTLIHNALFDMQVLPRMRFPLEWDRVRDTMLDASFNRCLPHGLKALSWRLLGVRMNEYDDLVTLYGRKPAIKYLMQVAAAPKGTINQPYLKPRQWTAQRKAHQAVISCLEGEAEPLDRWQNWEQEDRDAIEEYFGRYPYPNIKQVPFDLAVHYSCQDADCEYRIEKPLTRELVKARRIA